MVPGDDLVWCAWKRSPQTRELVKRQENGRVRRTGEMEDVAGDQDHVGSNRDEAIGDRGEGGRDVRLPLILPTRGDALMLAKTEMKISEVGDAHIRAQKREL
jgi:hypothetical protein